MIASKRLDCTAYGLSLGVVMPRVLMMLAAVATAVVFTVLSFRARADPSEEVCNTPGPCRTISIVREPGSTTFLLFGGVTFTPLPHWIKREIVEISDGNYVRFAYQRADGSTACELAFMTFGSADPGLEGAWNMFVRRPVERGHAKIVVLEEGSAHVRRIAVLNYKNGETMQVDLRRIADAPKGPMYELSKVGVVPATTAITNSDPDVSACHVRRAPV